MNISVYNTYRQNVNLISKENLIVFKNNNNFVDKNHSVMSNYLEWNGMHRHSPGGNSFSTWNVSSSNVTEKFPF